MTTQEMAASQPPVLAFTGNFTTYNPGERSPQDETLVQDMRHAFRETSGLRGEELDEGMVALSEGGSNALRHGNGLLGAAWGGPVELSAWGDVIARGPFGIVIFDCNFNVATLEEAEGHRALDVQAAIAGMNPEDILASFGDLELESVSSIGPDTDIAASEAYQGLESGRGLGIILGLGFAVARICIEQRMPYFGGDTPVMATGFIREELAAA